MNQELSSALFRLGTLERRAGGTGAQSKLLAQLLRELQNALEELQVANEQLRLDSEEIGKVSAQLAAERERFREFFDALPMAYVITTEEGIIEDGNRTAATLLNISQRFLVGKSLALFVGQGRAEFMDGLEKVRLGLEQPPEMVLQLRPRERAPVQTRLNVSIVQNGDGKRRLRWLLSPR